MYLEHLCSGSRPETWEAPDYWFFRCKRGKTSKFCYIYADMEGIAPRILHSMFNQAVIAFLCIIMATISFLSNEAIIATVLLCHYQNHHPFCLSCFVHLSQHGYVGFRLPSLISIGLGSRHCLRGGHLVECRCFSYLLLITNGDLIMELVKGPPLVSHPVYT